VSFRTRDGEAESPCCELDYGDQVVVLGGSWDGRRGIVVGRFPSKSDRTIIRYEIHFIDKAGVDTENFISFERESLALARRALPTS
jgi:hypothetical protein